MMMWKSNKDGRITLKTYKIPLGRTIHKSAHMPQYLEQEKPNLNEDQG